MWKMLVLEIRMAIFFFVKIFYMTMCIYIYVCSLLRIQKGTAEGTNQQPRNPQDFRRTFCRFMEKEQILQGSRST